MVPVKDTAGRRNARRAFGVVSVLGACLAAGSLTACAGADDDREERRIAELRAAIQVAASGCFVSEIGSNLNLGDDTSVAVALPFSFNFYGQQYSQVYVNANGNISFAGPNPSAFATALTNNNQPLIGVLSGDLNPGVDGAGGTADGFLAITGTAPNRAAVITWYLVPEYADSAPNTFQAVLGESGGIVLSYQDLGTDGVQWSGQPIEVGVTSGAGQATMVASGASVPALANTTVALSPDASGNFSASNSCGFLAPPPPPPPPANNAPVASAGADQTVECTGGGEAIVTLDGSGSSDPDGDALSYSWSSAGVALGSTATVDASFPLGSYTATLSVDDGKGGTATDSVNVTVQDSSAPAISKTVLATQIRPYRHRMVKVLSGVSSSDACCSTTTNVTVSGSSRDYRIIDNGGSFDVYVRATHRATYAIGITATDCNGNTATDSVTVVSSR